MNTRVFLWRRSQRSQPSSQPSSQRRAFTLLEVMIATMILAVGMSAALDAIWNNNNFRRNLDETAMADLVLRQMASRLKTTSIFELGHPYEVKNASGTVTSAQPSSNSRACSSAPTKCRAGARASSRSWSSSSPRCATVCCMTRRPTRTLRTKRQ